MQAKARQLCNAYGCWRSWRTAEASSSRTPRRFLATVAKTDGLLKAQEDWSAFQLDRAEERIWLDHYSQYGSKQTRDNTWQPHHSLHRPPSPGELTLSALLAAGAHLGHSTSLLNPNFMPYTYGSRAGITIIDLDRTVPMLRRAANLTRAIAANNGTVVFIGSRPDLRSAVKKASERMGEQSYYVGEKWLPGTLTNRLHHFGTRTVESTKIIPDLLVILNPLANMPAIREAAIEHIPTIGREGVELRAEQQLRIGEERQKERKEREKRKEKEEREEERWEYGGESKRKVEQLRAEMAAEVAEQAGR
ncbi:hypothetical protein EW145_g2871 [Phellinidium pouzarii]|uniref:Ribosomal protein S2 n=1 Tax=Phellinidium pouzarii TaxID=167371 RepID=A0A4S4L9S0_9AGAM|nr:hypothetical protein EW145_g2871 [Phellinidium pouzarii]